MHYLYILKSLDSGKYYIGETSNISNRLKEHQQRKTSFGKRNSNLTLVYSKEVDSRSKAKKLEKFIKDQKSSSFIEKIIKGIYTPL